MKLIHRFSCIVVLIIATLTGSCTSSSSPDNGSAPPPPRKLVPAPPGAQAPVDFPVPATSAQAALDEMAANKDSALAEVEALFPTFRQDFIGSFSQFWQIALRSLVVPVSLKNAQPLSDTERLERTSLVFTALIRNIQVFVMENIMNKAAPNFDEPYDINYAYCEQHPGDTSTLCTTPVPEKYDLPEWAITRRLLSSATFINAICPAIRPFALWNFAWNSNTDQDRKQVQMFLAEADRVLQFFYGDGVWKVSDKDVQQLNTPFFPGIPTFLMRRYLDGGPASIAAMRTCLSAMKADFEGRATGSVLGADKTLNEILQFQPITLPDTGKVLQLQTVPVDHDMFYRLSHRLSAGTALPQPLFDPADRSSPYVAGDYLTELMTSNSYSQGVDDSSYSAGAFANLVSQLNTSDLAYKYRSPTRDEFRELVKIPGSTLANVADACVFEGDVNSDDLAIYDYYPGDPDFEPTDWSMICPREGFLLVREAKVP